YPIGLAMLTVPVDATGAFGEVRFGTPTQSASQVEVQAVGKCPQVGFAYIANGADTTVPTWDTTRTVYADKPSPQPDKPWPDPGACTDNYNAVVVQCATTSSATTAFGPLILVQSNGGFPETPIQDGFGHPWVVFRDKAGNYGTASPPQHWVDTNTTSGRSP